jgi:hypothetical protein
MVLDVDGDGTGNLVVYDDDLGRWAGLEFVQGVPQWREDWFSNVSLYPRFAEMVVIDSNGDGLRDILALPDNEFGFIDVEDDRPAVLLLNTGKGFVQQHIEADDDDENNDTTAPRYPAAVIDYDHDGIEELIEPRTALRLPPGLRPGDFEESLMEGELSSRMSRAWTRVRVSSATSTATAILTF